MARGLYTSGHMNIGLINEYFPPFAPGGAEWSTLQLGRTLVEQGHSVTIITPNYGASSREELYGMQIVRFPYPARLKGRRTLRLRWLASPGFYIWSAVQIWYHSRQAHLDILHAQNKYSLPGTWLAGRWLHLPVVATIRDTMLICPFGRCLMRYDELPEGCGHGELWRLCRAEHIEQYIRPGNPLNRLKAQITTSYLRWDLAILRWVLGQFDGVIAVSQGILSLYQQAGVRLGQQTAVVYNIPPQNATVRAISEAELRNKFKLRDGPLVLYVGKFSPGKGTEDLVAAAKRVIQDMPDAQFAFVGGTELNGQTDSTYIHVLGHIPNADVLQLYKIADLVVVPSVWPEPLSRVLLEAMAMGRAVIGTRVGGTPELIEDGCNGLLVPRSSPEELAQAINTLLRDQARRQQMGEASQRLIRERFNVDQSINKLVAFYNTVGADR